MKTRKRLHQRRYGMSEYGLADLPSKVSNIKMIFPEGFCCISCERRWSMYNNDRTSWKNYRKHQYRIK